LDSKHQHDRSEYTKIHETNQDIQDIEKVVQHSTHRSSARRNYNNVRSQ
jgi:hypothetical protein